MAKFTNSGLVKSGDIAFKGGLNVRTMIKTNKESELVEIKKSKNRIKK